MGSFDAGRIVATADLDREPFQRSLRLVREEGRKLAAERYQPKVGADVGDGDRKVAEFRTKLDRLSTKRVTPTLSVDNAAGLVKLVDFQDRLDAIREKVAEARVDVDDDAAKRKLDALDIQLRRVGTITSKPRVSVEGVERANLQLDALELKLRALGASTARPNVGGAGGGGLFSRLAAAGGRGGFFGGLGSLLVGGSAAAVPLGVGALGLGAGFLSPTIAGGTGLGLFGAASKSAITRVADTQKKLDALNARIANTPATVTTGAPRTAAQQAAAQARLTAAQANLRRAQYVGGAARIASAQSSVASAQAALQAGGQHTKANPELAKLQKQRTELLAKMTPAERKAAEGIERLDKGWVKFQRGIEPQTFKVVADGTAIITRGLHDLLPMTKAVGDDVDDLAKRAQKAFKDPFWQQFFGQFLTREAPRAVNALGTTVGNIGTGLAHLAEDFTPLGHDLEDSFVRWSAMFDKWTQGQGPARFVALVERDGPVAADALKALASGATGLAKGLEPIGRIELQALTPVLNFIGKLGDEHPAVITALGAAYLSVAGGLKAIAGVKAVGGALGVLTGGRIGGKGGGILGGISKTEPVPVYVVNEGFGGAGIGGRIGGNAGKLGSAAGSVLRVGSIIVAGDLIAESVGKYLHSGGIKTAFQLGRADQARAHVASVYQDIAFDNPQQQKALNNLRPDVITALNAGMHGNFDPIKQVAGELDAVLAKYKKYDVIDNQRTLNQLLVAVQRPQHQPPPVTNYNFNLPGATFTNVNSPTALGKALLAQQRLRALSGYRPQGERRVDF